MTKSAKIKDEAYMILNEMAMCFRKSSNGKGLLKVYNLKKITQYSLFVMGKDDFKLIESCMPETNMYKSLFIVERNKAELLRGYYEWENIQKGE